MHPPSHEDLIEHLDLDVGIDEPCEPLHLVAMDTRRVKRPDHVEHLPPGEHRAEHVRRVELAVCPVTRLLLLEPRLPEVLRKAETDPQFRGSGEALELAADLDDSALSLVGSVVPDPA